MGFKTKYECSKEEEEEPVIYFCCCCHCYVCVKYSLIYIYDGVVIDDDDERFVEDP